MGSIALALAFLSTAQSDRVIDGPTVFALLQRYHSSFRDVSFVHEGAVEDADAGRSNPDPFRRFQTFYAYRTDGATLLDLFSQQSGKPKGRAISSILRGRKEILNATPGGDTPIRVRVPGSGPGGPGSLGGPQSPERIFLAWYFPTLGEPAEHDFKSLGWEDVSGHRCLKVSMLRQPKKLLEKWHGSLPYIRLWIDPERDGYPVRYEYYRGEDLHMRCEITRMERLQVPNGRAIWFPMQGKVWSFLGQERGAMVPQKEPTSIETHGVLIQTVKFNQGLNDPFFSLKKHALVASDEGLRKLQRELESEAASKKQEVVPADPESRRRRLDEVLAEADRQARQLEASSAARAGFGWSEALYGSLGAVGVLMLGIGAFWRWRTR